MLSLLPADLSGLRVVDVGCGTGRYMQHAFERSAGRVIGIDQSRAMLAHAVRGEVRDACLVQASLARLPVRDAVADVVMCALTLGHVAPLADALRELCRVLAPNGLIVCSDFHPIGESLGWQRTFKAGDQRYAVRHYTHAVDDWQTACVAAGLGIQKHVEAFIDAGDIPVAAHFDPRAMILPVAHAFALHVNCTNDL